MRASGERLVANVRPDDHRWVAMITWRLGHGRGGPYNLSAATMTEIKRRLRALDPTVEFHAGSWYDEE